MSIKKKYFNSKGEHIGWFENKPGSKTYTPKAEFDKQKAMSSNSDFEGIAYKFKTDEHKTDAELITEQNIMLKELENLSKYEKMSSRKKYELLATARKAFNRFYTYADSVFIPNKLDDLQQRFEKFTLDLNRYTHIKKQPQGLDLATYRQTIGAMKQAELKQYLDKGLFQYTQRITLFDLYKKGDLEQAMIKYAKGNRGSGQDYDQQIDEFMAMLDREFPTGYLKVPVVNVTEKNGVKVQKKNSRQISIDYYIKTWVADVNATVDNAAIESAYMQAGIDLVLMRNEGEDACPLCGPDTNKIFSLSGTDPDFPIAPYRPIHPNCDCYYVPMLTKEYWRKNPLSQQAAEQTKKGFNDSFENYSSKTAAQRKAKNWRQLEDGLPPLAPGVTIEPTLIDPDEGFGNPDYGMKNEAGKLREQKRQELLQSLKDSDIINYEKNIKNAIKTGDIDTRIHTGDQKKHLLETLEEGKSLLTADAQEMIEKYAGTGKIQYKPDGSWNDKELIKAEEELGQYIYKNSPEPSKMGHIVYSKSGAHIYPVNPKKEEGYDK